MPYCCVRKCSNSWKKGYSLYRIPKNLERRKQWIQNIGRHDLALKDCFVCEVHFLPEMWEKIRVDGKKKLKSCAVPTVFIQKEIVSASSNTEIDIMENNEDNEKYLSDNLIEKDAGKVQKALLDSAQAELETEQTKLQQVETKLQQTNMMLSKLEKSQIMLKKKIKRLMYEKKKLQEENSNLKARYKRIFNDDQVKALCKKSMRGNKWSIATVKKAIRLRLSCGNNGYKELQNQNIPLPAERTLRRKIENINFEPGICHETFDILCNHVSSFIDNREKDCMLAIDEMSITAGQQIDIATNSHFGLSTLPDRSGHIKEATHSLVFMLGVVFTRWKIVVAYYLTPDSINGTILKPIIQKIIEKAESIGLYVHSITTDMGPVNLSMWKAFNAIGSNRYSEIRNYVPHPVDSNRKLFFIADGPHLLKNLKSTLLNNKVIELPKTFVDMHNLSSTVVECAHLEELVDIQENLQFKLIPKLKKKTLPVPHLIK